MYPEGNKILLCPLPENMPKCQLMELTAQNRAALAQRHYRFRSKLREKLTLRHDLTLKRIKCKDQANGLNAEFVRDRNEIDYAKGSICKQNEYELTFWSKEVLEEKVNINSYAIIRDAIIRDAIICTHAIFRRRRTFSAITLGKKKLVK
jgi:hypothetical protein